MAIPPQPESVGVVIAVPSRGTVRIEWAAALNSLALPINCSSILQIITGQKVEDARNTAVAAARRSNAEYLFFLDDDVLPPNQSLRRFIHLLENNPSWDLISGIVPVKSRPPEPAVFKNGRPGPYWGWKFNQTFEIDACGMACCLIRMSAFDKVPEPWFEWVRGYNGAHRFEEGEDVGFCRKLKEAGGTLYGDGGVLCGHMAEDGTTFMLPLDSAPFEGLSGDDFKGYTVLEPEKVA